MVNTPRGVTAEEEEWRPVRGWPYDVSSLGRLRRTAPGKKTYPGYIHAPRIKDNGYPAAHLTDGKRRKNAILSRLVCEAFHGPPFPGAHADHIDTNPLNCRADNLRWLTAAENYARVDHFRGCDHPMAKVDERDVAAIRAAPAKYVRDMMNRIGMSNGNFHAIRSGKIWRHLP